MSMINIEEHMIGFRVENEEIYLRDNEEVVQKVNDHGKKNKNIKWIWTK